MRHDTSDATLQAVLVLVTGELHAGTHGPPPATRPRRPSHTRMAERHRHGHALSTHWIRLSHVLPSQQGGDNDATSAFEDILTIGATTADTATESAETLVYFIQAGRRP